MAGVSFGSPVSSANTNSAFMYANGDTGTVGRVQLLNTLTASGVSISNLQASVNGLASALGVSPNVAYNYIISWATNYVGATNDTTVARINAICALFSGSTGHTHDGTDGQGPNIDVANVANVTLKGAIIQGTNVATGAASSTDVSSVMTGKIASSGSTVKGVVVTAPYNYVVISNANGTEIVDGSGNLVYARITNSGSTWTLSYYSLVSSVETVYTFGSTVTISWYYQQLINPIEDAGFEYSPILFVPSDNATADVIDATSTLRGLVNATTQTFGGKKTLSGGLIVEASLEFPQYVDSTTTGSSASVPYNGPFIELTNTSLVSINNIGSPTDGKYLILANNTGSAITILNKTGGTTANQIRTGTNSSMNVLNGAAIFLVYDANTSLWQVVGGSGSGSGGTGKNYIDALNGESGVTAFQTYSSGAALPTNGTGGSPTCVLSTTSSSSLSGLNSLLYTPGGLGNGFSSNFTIDNEDQTNILWLDLSLEFSGTYNDDDISVWLYDVTNSALITANSSSYIVSSPIISRQSFSFQLSQSTSYRLIVHQATSNSSYTMKLEGAIGPRSFAGYGIVGSDPKSYTPIFTGFSSLSLIDFKYSREGKYLIGYGTFQPGSVAGSVGSISIPNGLTIDSDLPSSSSGYIAVGTSAQNNVGNQATVVLAAPGGTNIYFSVYNNGSVGTLTPQNANTCFAAGTSSVVYFKVPIQGWSGESPIISEYDGRIIALGVDLSTSQNLTTTQTTINWGPADTDTANSWNGSSTYTISQNGVYDINGDLEMGTPSSGYTGTVNAYLFINGASSKQISSFLSTGIGNNNIVPFSFEWNSLTLKAGDQIYIQINANNSYPSTPLGNGRLSISMKSGAQKILAGQDISARYTGNGLTVLANSAFGYGTKIYDTTGSYNSSTGIFTSQINGYIHVDARMFTGAAFGFYLYVNGSLYSQGSTGSSTTPGIISDWIKVSVEDTFNIQSDTAGTTTGGAGLNNISIKQF